MNIFDLTSSQLKRAAAIKDQIEALNNELRRILGASAAATKTPSTRAFMKTSVVAKPMKFSAKPKKKVFSASTRAKLSAKLKAYWAAKKAGKK